MADLSSIGKGLGRIGAGISAMSGNQRVRELGLARIQDNEARDEKAHDANKNIQLKMLDMHITALQSGKYTEEDAAPIIDNTRKLMQAVGMEGDPTGLFVPKEQEKDVRLGNTLQRPNAKGGYDVVATAPREAGFGSSVGRLIGDRQTLIGQFGEGSPQVAKFDELSAKSTTTAEFERLNAIPIDQRTPEVTARLKILTTRAPQRPSSAGFMQQRMAKAQSAYDEAEETYNKSKKLADLIPLANRKIDKRVGDGLGGVGEAAKLREKINSQATALKTFDQQNAKIDELLKKNPDVLTIGPDAANAIRVATTNIIGVYSSLFGNPEDAGKFNARIEEWAKELDDTALGKTEMRAALFSVAMQDAIANGLDRNGLTNDEFKRSLEDIGGSTTSARGLKIRLKEVRTRLANAFKANLESTVENYAGVSEPAPTTIKSIRILP